MATRRASGGQLWQVPTLLVSLGLFLYAAYLFINPAPGATIDQKIAVARDYLKQSRPDAAREQLNKILASEKLTPDREAACHLMLAQSLEDSQKQLRISVPENYQRIIEQIQLAIGVGAKPDGDVYRRLADSHAALGHDDQALQNYRMAIALDPAHTLPLQRKEIELQLSEDEPWSAASTIDDYLKHPELTDAERSWALDAKAGLLVDQKKFAEARTLLSDAMKLNNDPIEQGRFNYRLGYCAWKQGDTATAERYLRLARDQLRTQNPLDADVCFALGRIYQDREDPKTANSFFEIVLTSHPESSVAPLARLGRGLCRISLAEYDAGLTDLHDLTNEVNAKPSKTSLKDAVLAGLRVASQLLTAAENYQGALEVLSYEQTLTPAPSAGFFARLAGVYEKRADQLEQSIADAPPAEKIRREQMVRDFRTKAGDSYIANSRQLTLSDDKAYGDALWRGIDLYDRAGNMQCVISALELFVTERPSDPQTPDALLRLGRTYQAAGLLDKAIHAYNRIQLESPNSLAASKSLVPLAQACIAKGPELNAKAEQVLLSVVQNNDKIDPSAEEFRQALFELAQLYYRTNRFEEAVSKLEELTKRYPNDDRLPQLVFMMADSYRKSASLLDVRLASASASAGQPNGVAEAVQARKDRLQKAADTYTHAIELYNKSQPKGDSDKLYQKLSYFYRADCIYDLGKYEDAIKLYDEAAYRYQDDPSALAADVQIVNSYFAEGKIEEAKTANQRAKVLLNRMPPEAFTDGTFAMPKQYWEQWLKWTGDSGMW